MIDYDAENVILDESELAAKAKEEFIDACNRVLLLVKEMKAIIALKKLEKEYSDYLESISNPNIKCESEETIVIDK